MSVTKTDSESKVKREPKIKTSFTSARSHSDEKRDIKTSPFNINSHLYYWTELSRINYLSAEPLDVITTSGQSIRRKSFGLQGSKYSIQYYHHSERRIKSNEDLLEAEQFPVNVTPLMDEGQLWGCFYIFPDLYSDVYSPIIQIRKIEDVPQLESGILTGDMVTACLSYLSRTPILGDYVYIKLDLSAKRLININILQHFKYIVYLDLSANLLSELTVLSHLPYLQFLSVAFNRLETVLEYDSPQWFLTEVHYKYNSVEKIRDLNEFWSITSLDLSHNNIKHIHGLETLRYLRRLDLSFNHIKRLENLNHLRLVWLDVSYNNISTFEFGPEKGLFTLLHLEFLNLNENNLTSMKMFAGCTRLRELHVRNNGLKMLLELAVYMRQLRRLIVLDLRANPICSTPGYKHVAINTFPLLLSLDAEELDPITQCNSKMKMTPDVNTYATERLLRLLYIQHLSKAHVYNNIPPADTKEVPIVILVGYEAVGKGSLARRLAAECSANIELALQHTTASHHHEGHYREISRSKFDDMLLAGELLTYCEAAGESYGLSREEAFVTDNKVKLVTMDLIGALMLRLRGRRPYMILTTCMDKVSMAKRQLERKRYRNATLQQRISKDIPVEKSTLQVLLSERIIITGIINEILLSLPGEVEQSEFMSMSDLDLMMNADSEIREVVKEYARGVNMLTLIASSSTSLEDVSKRVIEKQTKGQSLHSLFKKQGDSFNEVPSFHASRQIKKQSQSKHEKNVTLFRAKSVDYSASATWKAGLSMHTTGGSKSSKSVTFISPSNEEMRDPIGMVIQPRQSPIDQDRGKALSSISTRMPWSRRGRSSLSLDDSDLWLAFLTETGLMRTSSVIYETSDMAKDPHQDSKVDDPANILDELDFYHKKEQEYGLFTTTIRDDYDNIHRKYPGLFWSVVNMDNPNEAFHKVKKNIQEIVKSQPTIKQMFNINFANMDHYPTVQDKLAKIYNQVAPQRLFY